ncbi:MAG: hypothetical protein HYV42_04555 [Candidatus Magasanikbacteria bacterium]|nr:hypothetical protein [Candidatus Magasanikbacteria bacterium]
MKKLLLGGLAGALVVGSASFYGGMKYAQSKIPARMRGGAGENFPGAQFGARGQRSGRLGAERTGGNRGDSLAAGEILAVDGQSLTVKLRDGGSKIIFFSASTTIGKITAGATSDLTAGTPVIINGSGNPDGSLTAANIQIRSALP